MKHLTRREALARAAWFAGLSGMPFAFTAASDVAPPQPWSTPDLKPVDAAGYGTDPDLIHPQIPWPKTLTATQKQLLRVLCDILLPEDDESPAASAIGVPEVIDEWISAPYPSQHQHRVLLLSGLTWCDAESKRRYGHGFVAATPTEQTMIIDDIAGDTVSDKGYAAPQAFFAGFRELAAGIYYSIPEGGRVLGYVGNVAIAGEYPGPTEEARNHLEAVLRSLDLKMPV